MEIHVEPAFVESTLCVNNVTVGRIYDMGSLNLEQGVTGIKIQCVPATDLTNQLEITLLWKDEQLAELLQGIFVIKGINEPESK